MLCTRLILVEQFDHEIQKRIFFIGHSQNGKVNWKTLCVRHYYNTTRRGW